MGDQIKEPTLPEQMFQPMGVGLLLQNEKDFPALAGLLRNFDENESEFLAETEIDDAYENVKAILRRNAGIPPRRQPEPVSRTG